ncbi:hypothetical protein P692DRAFT_20837664 [Suillus brevipes Sb2]|nr:hypothetical protein P692DRAFT_20837664 [Suillus brevipes Sb2]
MHQYPVLKSFELYQNNLRPQVPPSTHQPGACCPSIHPRLLDSDCLETSGYCFCAVFTSRSGTKQCSKRLFDVEGVPRYFLESMTPMVIHRLSRVAKTHHCAN